MIRRLEWAGLGLLLGLAATIGPAGAGTPMARYVAGEHYTVLAKPVPTAHAERTDVIEFFLYSCPHCYHFEETINKWAQDPPDGVAFRKVPVLFGSDGKMYARMYYTERALGVLDSMHSRIFDAIHQDGRRLNTKADIRKFFVANGVDGKAFDAAFDSAAVDRRVRKAGDLMRAYRVTAVPSMGVAGRYWLNGRQAGSNADMLDVADYLIRKVQTSN